MAISKTERKKVFIGNDSADSFDFPFKVLNKNDFTLIHTDVEGVDSLLVADTDYSINNIGSDTGINICYPLDSNKSKLQAGEKITGYRTTSLTQLLDFLYGGGFSPRIHENAFDKVMMILQEHSEELSRRPVFPITAVGYDIFTWTDGIETGTKKAVDDSAAALSAASAAQTAATGAQTAANKAAEDSAGAVTASGSATSTANIAKETAEGAAQVADETAALVEEKVVEIAAAVTTVNDKLNIDGSNIDKLAFLQNAGFSDADLNIDLSEVALKTEVDAAIAGLDSVISDAVANINKAVALEYQEVIDIDLAVAKFFKLTLTGDCIINNPLDKIFFAR